VSLSLQVLLSGLAAGGIYGLLAVGHTLVYRLTGIVHFAFGDLVGLAMFVALLVLAYRAFLAVPRGQQYTRFLANPDSTGPTSATFVYRSAPPATVAVHTFRSGDGEISTLAHVARRFRPRGARRPRRALGAPLAREEPPSGRPLL
jgi:Branched-chain amino acid transport system / permease component